MRVRWMQLAAQLFHEDPNRAADVCNRSVYEANHEGYIIAATPLECVPGQALCSIRLHSNASIMHRACRLYRSGPARKAHAGPLYRLWTRPGRSALPKQDPSATFFSSLRGRAVVVPLQIKASLHPHFDLQLAVAGHLDRFSAFQVRLQHRRIAPLQLPAIGQSEHGVLAWHNIRKGKGAIAIALVPAE